MFRVLRKLRFVDTAGDDSFCEVQEALALCHHHKDKLTGFCPDPGKYLGDYQTVQWNAACTCSAFVTSPIPYYCIQGCKILQKSHLLIKFLSFSCCYKTQTAVECFPTLGITSYFSPHNWRAEPPSSKETPETRVFVCKSAGFV